MYLDNWMIATLVLSFGACAFLSRRSGFVLGATMTIKALEEQKFIKILEDGSIRRWTPHGEPMVAAKQPAKRARKKK